MGLIDSVRSSVSTAVQTVEQKVTQVADTVTQTAEKAFGHSGVSNFDPKPAAASPSVAEPAAPGVGSFPSIPASQLQNGLFSDIGSWLKGAFDNKPSVGDSNNIPDAGPGGKTPGPTATPEAKARYEKSVQDVAQKVATQGLGFGSPNSPKLNDALWEKDATKGVRYQLKDGVKPSDAVKDFMANSKKYEVDCAGAQKLVQYSAMMDSMGEKNFDSWVKQNGGMALPYQGAPDGALEKNVALMREAPGFDPKTRPPEAKIGEATWQTKNMQPGDNVYFEFKGAPPELRRNGYGGENAIYLGDGKYFAHPAGVCTKEQLNTQFQGALEKYNNNPENPYTPAELVPMQEIGRVK